MAKLETERAQKAARRVQSYTSEVMDDAGFLDDVTELIRAVQDEMEEAHLKGRVRFLGKPYLLYRLLEDCVGQERRPIWRETRIRQIRSALNEYLGLDFNPDKPKRKRKRKKLKRRRLLTVD